MVSGPRRRTLRELVAVCEDPALFSALADGRVVLTGQRQALQTALEISRGSLWYRTQALVEAGLATDDGQLVINLQAIRERLEPRVVSLPTERTREYQELLEERFDTSIAADGTPSFHHSDGRRATLSDIAAATGARSRGTVQHHLRRLSSVVPTDQPAAHCDVEDAFTSAADAAIESLSLLAETAATTGRTALASTVLAALDTVSRSVDTALISGDDGDVAVSARGQTRPDDGLREAKPVANPASAPPVSLQNEYENDSSHPHDGLLREPNRDINPAQPTGSDEAVSPCDRSFEDLPDWTRADWDDLIAPVATIWAEATSNELRIDGYCIDACLAWPKSYVRRAITRLGEDIEAGRSARNPSGLINNPGGLLAAAARDGKLRYFPLRPPEVAADPELAREQYLSRCRVGVAERVASGGDGFSLANAALSLATVNNAPDREALAVIVESVHSEIIDTERRNDFDDQLMTLVGTQLTWSNTGLASVSDIVAYAPRKAHSS